MASLRKARSGESVLDEIFNDSESEMEFIDDSDSDENLKSSSSESEADEVPGDEHGQAATDTSRQRNRPRLEFDKGWTKLGPNDDLPNDYNPSYHKQPGPKPHVLNDDAFHVFSRFFPAEIFAILTAETNRYASQYFDNPLSDELPQFSRFRKWKAVTEDEMRIFVGLEISMGLATKNTLKQYWEKYWLTMAPAYGQVMSRDRYLLIRTFLHFSDNEHQPNKGQQDYDPLYKVRKLINVVKNTYLECYQPHQTVAIDEIMKRFKGRLSFKQYIPNKPCKWGIKIWALCDSVTGYNIRWNVYTGKAEAGERDKDQTLGSHVVCTLLDGIENGLKVFMDNFFSSPELFWTLKEQGYGACGTVRVNRKGLPKGVGKQNLKMKQGDSPIFFHSEGLTFTTWQDTSRVNCISTLHGNLTVDKQIRSKKPGDDGTRTIKKPALVDDYNRYMGGVDKFDQLSSYYHYPHKCQKWYQVLFHFIRETALVNGCILYNMCHPEDNIDQIAFRQKVIDGLIPPDLRLPQYASPKGVTLEVRRKRRLFEKHYLAINDNKKRRPECIVCSDRKSNQRHQTLYYCEDCEQPMCAAPCFKRYHTLLNYKLEYNG